jgi:signal peptide peptidase SppA
MKLPWNPTTIPVVTFRGVIAPRRGAVNLGSHVGPLARGFEMAQKQEKLLICAIESPGGSPVQSDLIGAYIRRRAEQTGVKVVAVIGDVGASGGYWIACAADEIRANKMSIVGSIGVIGGGFGLQDFIRRYGIERRVMTSGTNKLRNDPFSEQKPEDVEFTQELLDDIHEQFKVWVRERRGARLNGDEAKVFDGSYMLGTSAKELGLIDGFGDVRSVIRERAGDKAKPMFIEPKRDRNLLRLLGGMGAAAAVEAFDTKLAELRGGPKLF